MQYLGDYPVDATVYCLFNTYSSDDPSASMTITGLALADIKIYKNGGTTERSSTSGFTLLDTDGIDFDTHVGIHGFSIDTSDNTDAGFFAAGGEYTIVVASVTLDAATINFVAGHFSIERTGGALALLKNANYGLAQLVRSTTPANTLDVNATGEAGLDFDNTSGALTDADITSVAAVTGNVNGSVGSISGITFPTNFADLAITVTTGNVTVGTNNDKTGYSISGTKTTLDALNDITAAAASAAVWDEDATGHQTQGTFGQAIGDPGADADTIWGLANTNLDATVSSRSSHAATDIVSAGAITTNGGAVSTVTTTTTVTNDVGVNEWNGVALGTTNPLPNAAAGAAGGLPTDSTGKTSFNDVSTAQVNAEVVDVMKTDTIAEQAQGIPPSTPTFEEAVMYLYMALRNKIDVTSSLKEFHNDAGTVVWKKSVSDDTTTYSEAKGASGP